MNFADVNSPPLLDRTALIYSSVSFSTINLNLLNASNAFDFFNKKCIQAFHKAFLSPKILSQIQFSLKNAI